MVGHLENWTFHFFGCLFNNFNCPNENLEFIIV